jgi:hypothetical protein
MDLFKDLDDIIREATEASFREVYGELLGEQDERKKQQSLSGELSDYRAPDKKDEVDEAEGNDEEDAAAPSDEPKVVKRVKKDTPKVKDKAIIKADVPDSEELADAGVADLIDQLNMMRSGKSAKDEDVRNNLEDYWDQLTPGERQSLFVFLSGLTQMLTTGVAADKAPDPAQVGIKVQAKRKKAETTSPSQAHTAAKAAATPGETPKRGSAGLPIVVGEIAQKGELRRRLMEMLR